MTAMLGASTGPSSGPLDGPVTDRAVLLAMDAAAGVALLALIVAQALVPPAAATSLDAAPLPEPALLLKVGAPVLAVLAGVTVSLGSGGARVSLAAAGPVWARLALRAALIGVVGLALGSAGPAAGAVLLPYYAVLFVLAVPLVVLPSGLLGVVAALVVGLPLLTGEPAPSPRYPPGGNPALIDVLHQPLPLLEQLSLTGAYPALLWTAYLCVGLVVGRLTLTRLSTAAALVGAGCTSLLLGMAAARFPLDASEILRTNTASGLLAGTGLALVLFGSLLWLGHLRRPVPRLLAGTLRVPLAGVGAIALSAYAGHVLFVNSVAAQQAAPVTVCVLQVGVALLVGLGWRATAGRDPLDVLRPRAAAPEAVSAR